MNKEDFVKIMNGLAKVYDKELDKETLELWLSFFNDDNIDEFRLAINEHIKTNSKFPTIAHIKNKMFELTHKEQYSNDELWNTLVKALGRSSYYAEEEFEKLPDLVKRYVRSPQQLQELARIDSDIIHSVEKGQFMKQIEKIKQEYKNDTITKRNDRLLQEKGIYMIEEIL